MSQRCWALLFLAGLFTLPARAEDDQSRPEVVLKQFTEGNRALANGAYLDSVTAYKNARKAAREKDLPAVEAEAALHLGEVLQAWALTEKDPQKRADRLGEAEQYYQDAIRLGSPKVKLLAQNNLGVLYVRLGKGKA